MPLSQSVKQHPSLKILQRFREHRPAVYGIAVAAVALSTLARWVLVDVLYPGAPFITFYPAIFIAAFLGGAGPGIAALALSAFAASFLFIPPAYTLAPGEQEVVTLALFLVVGGFHVLLITLLNRGLDRVLTQEEQLRTLLDANPSGVIVVNEHGTITVANTATEHLFGYPHGELIGRQVETLVPERLRGAHERLRRTYDVNPQTRRMGIGQDLSGQKKDGSKFPVEVGLAPLRDGARRGVLATVIDISERKHAQERQTFLANELRHRARNLLSVVMALVRRSLVESPESERQALLGRLTALGSATSMLVDSEWQGAPLSKLVEQELSGFSDRVTVRGCDIVLTPSTAQDFALILHELATNASKYGALSTPEGRVLVQGGLEKVNGCDLFTFTWAEHGGPPVAEPIRKGFGTLILTEMARRFAESVHLEYEPEGHLYRLQAPLNALTAKGDQANEPLVGTEVA